MKGTCCFGPEGCTKVDFCSSDTEKESRSRKYFACPHSFKACGLEDLIVPNNSGETEIVSLNRDYQQNFWKGELCRYRLLFPPSAGDFDQMILTVNGAENVQIIISQAESYTSKGSEDQTLNSG